MMMQDLYEQKLDQNDGLPEDDLGIVHHMFSRILNLRNCEKISLNIRFVLLHKIEVFD